MRIVMVWRTWSRLAILFSPTVKSTRNCDVKWRGLLNLTIPRAGSLTCFIVLPLRIIDLPNWALDRTSKSRYISKWVNCKRVHGRHFTIQCDCVYTVYIELKSAWAQIKNIYPYWHTQVGVNLTVTSQWCNGFCFALLCVGCCCFFFLGGEDYRVHILGKVHRLTNVLLNIRKLHYPRFILEFSLITSVPLFILFILTWGFDGQGSETNEQRYWRLSCHVKQLLAVYILDLRW